MLAGISAPYYARLEQGTSRRASPDVLDAVARALELDDEERRHLHNLAATPRRRPSRRLAPERLALPLAQLLPTLHNIPALVLGLRLDVLAWNPLGHALLYSHLDAARCGRPADRPNSAVFTFLDPHTRELYADWPRKTRAVVGHLRMVAGRYPGDPQLTSLLGELTMRSSEFARLWADHTVGSCEGSTYTLHHPLVGAMTVQQQTLHPASASDQQLVTFTVEPDTASAEAMHLLADHKGASANICQEPRARRRPDDHRSASSQAVWRAASPMQSE